MKLLKTKKRKKYSYLSLFLSLSLQKNPIKLKNPGRGGGTTFSRSTKIESDRGERGEWSAGSPGGKTRGRGRVVGARRTKWRILTRGRSTGNWKGRGFEGLSCAPDSVSAAVHRLHPPSFIHERNYPAAAFHYSTGLIPCSFGSSPEPWPREKGKLRGLFELRATGADRERKGGRAGTVSGQLRKSSFLEILQSRKLCRVLSIFLQDFVLPIFLFHRLKFLLGLRNFEKRSGSGTIELNQTSRFSRIIRNFPRISRSQYPTIWSKRLKILVKFVKHWKGCWRIWISDRSGWRGRYEGKENGGKRNIWYRFSRKRSGGNRKEKVVAAREKLLVVASCPGKVHLAWQLLETVRYLVRQHLFGLRAAWTFENCP